MIQSIIFVLFAILFTGCSQKESTPISHKPHWAKPIETLSIENIHRIDDHLYKSAQPDSEGFKELYRFGIKNDLNLSG